MYPSDLTQYKTTHDLLLSLLYSEMGIYSVMHPAAMYDGVVLAHANLKSRLLSSTDEFVHSDILNVEVSRKEDMSLFYKLYQGINSCNEMMFSDEMVTHYGIMPVVAEMIATYPDVSKIVERACIVHADAHGDFVRARMDKTLHNLNINSYMRLNKKVA